MKTKQNKKTEPVFIMIYKTLCDWWGFLEEMESHLWVWTRSEYDLIYILLGLFKELRYWKDPKCVY